MAMEVEGLKMKRGIWFSVVNVASLLDKLKNCLVTLSCQLSRNRKIIKNHIHGYLNFHHDSWQTVS